MAQGNNPLSRFELNGVEEKEREIGRGSYAVVKELEFRSLSCVGKSIHEELYDNASDREREDMLARFETECELLSQLRHPHVVQFIGVHFKRGSRLPLLVMERLDTTLSACLDRFGKLPDEVSYPVIRDVAVGLHYLHGYTPNPVVHRDLTANNVLLTSDMKAKISDLGVAKILNLNPARMAQMTTCPGTPSYMPPEALVAKPIYTTKVDVFSYGNLMTHVFSGVWPIPTAVFRVDPSNPNVMVPATEVERREEYLQDMGDTHPLIALTRQCLSNNPLARPEAPEILARINEVMPQFPLSFQNKVEALQQIEADRNEKRSLISQIKENRQIEEKDRQIAAGLAEVSHSLEREGARTQVRELRSEIESLLVTIRTKKQLIISKQQQVQAAQDIATASQQELSITHQQLTAKDEVLDAKEQQLAVKDQELAAKSQQVKAKQQEVDAKDQELLSQVQELSATRAQLKAKQQQVTAKEQEVVVKEQVLSAKVQELSAMQALLEAKQQEVVAKEQVLSAKDQELNAQQSEISALREDIASKEAALEAKESIIMSIRSQTSQSLLLHPHTRLRWRRGADLPVAMYNHRIVRIGNNVYCGGGYTVKTNTSRQVFRYDTKQDEWLPLPICPTKQFGLTQLDGKLVTVGGSRHDRIIPINDVYVYEKSQTWRKSIPPFPTARFFPTAFAYKSTLVVNGGITHWNTDSVSSTRTTAVEVFQSKSSQWYCAEPLPFAHDSISCTIINDTCYLIGGYTGGVSRRAYCTSIPCLIATAVLPDHREETTATPQASPSSPTWQVLPQCPLYGSTAADLGGCLLAIGGKKSGSISSAVHVYSPSTNSWVGISSGDLLPPRWGAAATQLKSGEILFVGGADTTKPTTNVFIASLEQ